MKRVGWGVGPSHLTILTGTPHSQAPGAVHAMGQPSGRASPRTICTRVLRLRLVLPRSMQAWTFLEMTSVTQHHCWMPGLGSG